MELVRIKAGSFLMGSPETEVDRGALQGVWDLEAQHRVTLTKDFWLGRFPVTQSQWRAVMADGQETPPRSAAQQPRPAGDDYPMNFVSWDDAAAFTAALTARERAARRLPAGYEYRLPTEAEWEYAARAGTTSAHAGDVDAIAWHGQNSGGTIHPVGQKTPNAWGLFDMFGNVSQWCIGWGQRQYPDEAQTDPNGGPGYGFRIHRGGGFSAGLGQLRSAARSWQDADRRYAIFGFRVALAPAIPASILRPIENAPFIPPPIWIDTTDFDYPAGATLKPIPNRTAADSYIQSIPGAEVSSSGGIVGGIQTSGGGHLGIGFGANMPSRTTEGLLEIPYSGFQMSRSDNATRAGSKIRFATHVTTFDNGEPRALEQGFVMHSVGMQIVVRGTVEPGRPILLDYGGGSAAWEPNGSPMDAKRLKLLRPIPDSSPLEPLDPLERLTPAAPQPEEKVVKPIIVEPRKQANIFSFGFPSKSDPN
jgi:formylglycine-generating enzyme required for sulfatase activity